MESMPKQFKDKNGKIIKPGDVLIRHYIARMRERPGHLRVGYESMGGAPIIVRDEGQLKEPEPHWVKYQVKWFGACLIIDKLDNSNDDVLNKAEHFNLKGKPISLLCAFEYMLPSFESKEFEIVD